jgi:hypothetical protein
MSKDQTAMKKIRYTDGTYGREVEEVPERSDTTFRERLWLRYVVGPRIGSWRAWKLRRTRIRHLWRSA